MANNANIQNQNLLQHPYTIKKEVFEALSPLDKLAAKALEKCGKVRIVEQDREISAR